MRNYPRSVGPFDGRHSARGRPHLQVGQSALRAGCKRTLPKDCNSGPRAFRRTKFDPGARIKEAERFAVEVVIRDDLVVSGDARVRKPVIPKRDRPDRGVTGAKAPQNP